MMSPAQNKLYISTWIRVKKVLTQLGGMDAKEADAERHAIHIEALGRDKSSKAFTNEEFDRVLDAFKRRLIVTDHSAAPRAMTEPKKRLLWSIRNKGFDDDAIRGVCARCAEAFEGRDDFENFNESWLVTLRTQLEQWKRQKKHEPAMAAVEGGDPF
jgi:hypothetical protein